MIGFRGDFGKLAKLGGGLRSLRATVESTAPVIADRIGAIEGGRSRGDGSGRTPGEWPGPWTDAAEEEVTKAVERALGGAK